MSSVNPTAFLLVKFIRKMKASFKFKALWLIDIKKMKTKHLLQIQRHYKAISLGRCVLCMVNGELVDHLFLLSYVSFQLLLSRIFLLSFHWAAPKDIGSLSVTLLMDLVGLKEALYHDQVFPLLCYG